MRKRFLEHTLTIEHCGEIERGIDDLFGSAGCREEIDRLAIALDRPLVAPTMSVDMGGESKSVGSQTWSCLILLGFALPPLLRLRESCAAEM